MKRDIEQGELERAEIRAIQMIHESGHEALLNWGRWSRDRHGIFPNPNPPPSSIYDTIDRGEWDQEGYGDETEVPAERLAVGDTKAERAEQEPYNEREGTQLDQRIHGPGGLPQYLRAVIRVAYVTREVPEDQFYRLCGHPCTPDQFREWLAECLAWAGWNS